MPYIKAENENDLFFAQGFATAQDRLFQMDFDRRRCLGRWAEFAGKRALQSDILMRRRNLARTARQDLELSSPSAQRMLKAYSEGVNLFIRTTRSLPVEYSLLGTEPEPWEPWHCVAVYKTRNTAEGNFNMKTWLATLARELGAEKTAQIMPGYTQGWLLTVPPGAVCDVEKENPVTEMADVASLEASAASPYGESNGWAISGSRTESGLPLVAGDSHRMLDTPNVYMQIRLHCSTLSVIGHTVPGWPGVLHFCRNTNTAWGMTHGMADTQDLFAERFRSNGGKLQYLFRGQWHSATCRTETVKTAEGDVHEISASETRHGPIVSGDPGQGFGFAISDPGGTPTRWIDSAYRMMKARGADEFEAALTGWTDRVNNYPFADIAGNFGYALAGAIPIRSRANGFGPVPGWNGDHDWKGFIPRSKLPRVRNPELGWILTCNQRIVDHNYPYYISNFWAAEYRARRVMECISQSSDHPFSVDSMTSIHGERFSIPGSILRDAASEINYEHLDPLSAEALLILQGWDCRMDKDSAGAAIYAALRSDMAVTFARRHLGEFADEAVSGANAGGLRHVHHTLMPMMAECIRKRDPSVLGACGEQGETLTTALDRAVQNLKERLGSAPKGWKWGDLHKTGHVHPLSATFPHVASLLNPPSVRTHGDGDTPLAGAHLPHFLNEAASVNRYAFDLSDPDAGRWISPLGASGHPGSPHYSDQQPLWANLETIPQLWSWERVKRNHETVQCLEPLA